MRNLFVTVVAVIAMVLLSSPVQADQLSAVAQNVILESQCSDCETFNVTAPVRPQGENEGIQQYYHTWGGDPPDEDHWHADIPMLVCFGYGCLIACLEWGDCGQGTFYIDW